MSRDMPLSLIDADPEQPRKHFDAAQLDELAASMAQDGLAAPILLRPVGERFVIVHGERRWRAAQLLGWETIPADVRELSAEAAHWLALVENMQRADLSPIEEARFYEARMAEGMTQAELGKRIGKSQQYVADRLSLLRLEPEAQSLITARAVTPSVGRRLATVEDPVLQLRLARRVAGEHMTVKAVELTIAREAQREVMRDNGMFERWGNGDFSFARLVQADPDMEYYRDGIERGEFEFTHLAMRVRFKDLTRPLVDQPAPFPRYSGAVFTRIDPDWNGDFVEDLNLSLFSEDEWADSMTFDEEARLDDWIIEHLPGHFAEYKRPRGAFYPLCDHTRAEVRRSYDPEHGRMLVETGDNHCRCDCGDPYFIRRGWGQWRAVEFNDGEGGRECRRLFIHDVVTYTLINELRRTLDIDLFSDHNFHELALWNVQPMSYGWHAIRRQTIPKEAAIAALEADLARLKQAEPLTDEAIDEQVIERLQAYTYLSFDYPEWREGVCSYPRRDDGTVDAEIFRSLIDQCQRKEAQRQERRSALQNQPAAHGRKQGKQ